MSSSSTLRESIQKIEYRSLFDSTSYKDFWETKEEKEITERRIQMALSLSPRSTREFDPPPNT